jgi:hypothetical protein
MLALMLMVEISSQEPSNSENHWLNQIGHKRSLILYTYSFAPKVTLLLSFFPGAATGADINGRGLSNTDGLDAGSAIFTFGGASIGADEVATSGGSATGGVDDATLERLSRMRRITF